MRRPTATLSLGLGLSSTALVSAVPVMRGVIYASTLRVAEARSSAETAHALALAVNHARIDMLDHTGRWKFRHISDGSRRTSGGAHSRLPAVKSFVRWCQMDQVTQRKAAMVEKSTAASRAPGGSETDARMRLIGRFRVEKGTQAARARTAPALGTVGRGGAALASVAGDRDGL